MNLPNYFLADLPPDAVLSPTLVREACQTLKRNRERFLAERSTDAILGILSDVGSSWLQSDFPFRGLALEHGPGALGFSRATLANGLDSFFTQLTRNNLLALLEQDFGSAERLDRWSAAEPEQKQNRKGLASAPALVAHIGAGNIPNPALHSLVLGVLTRSAQFLKCARGADLLPRLFAHSLYEADRKLGACLEVAQWARGRAELEGVLFEDADCVTATGTDETLAAIAKSMPTKTRFLGYGHRASFAYVAASGLTNLGVRPTVEQAGADVVAWNQQGCLSPHVIYVQSGGGASPEQWAEALAGELDRREVLEPRGTVPTQAAADIASRRSFYQVRAAHSPETRQWSSRDSTAWTVVYESDPQFQMSCLNRFIYVKPAKDLTDALQGADRIRGKVSTVGLAAGPAEAATLATALARWGATRICPLGQMQKPPLSWRHDGRPALGDLVRWTDWEA
jgi:hypothetical protein